MMGLLKEKNLSLNPSSFGSEEQMESLTPFGFQGQMKVTSMSYDLAYMLEVQKSQDG